MLLFILALAAFGVAVELLLWAVAPFSLRAGKGPGQILLFAIVICSCVLFSGWVGGINSFRFLGAYLRDWRRILKGFIWIYLLTTALVALNYAWLAYTGQIVRSQKEMTTLLLLKASLAIPVTIVLATTEELIFRGFVLRYLRWNSSTRTTVIAVLTSAAIFSLSHLIALGYNKSIADQGPLLLGLFLLGILLGTAYVVTGSLACSIAVHAGLLGLKSFVRHAGLFDYNLGWAAGGGADMRLGPTTWVLFSLAALAFFLVRKWLWPKVWIETAVWTEKDADHALEFRLARTDDNASAAQGGLRTA